MLKRSCDVVMASLTLIVVAPLFVLVAFAILITMRRPIFFVQTRPGFNGVPFRLIKFRKMGREEGSIADSRGDAPRLTSLARFLQTTSIDELPELLNVSAGSMSLVGPRPLLMKYLPRYSSAEAGRHAVSPGLTGWAQINGRNDTTWEERFERDVWYVDHRSFGLDIRILLLTVPAVLMQRGVHNKEYVTMPEFIGHVDQGQ